MNIQLPDVTDTIFFEPGKTDELMAALEKQRMTLQSLHADSVEKGIELSEVVSDLQLMEEKTHFFAEMIEKTKGVFVPPPKGDAEVGMAAIQEHVFGNIDRFSSIAGLLAAPIVVDLAFKTGIYFGKISKVGRVSKLMKHARYAKVMKFAKGAMALAVAAELAGFVLNMAASKEMNDQIRAELADLKKKTAKGQKDYQTLVAGLKDAIAQRDEMLKQAGVDTAEDYILVINEGLAQMGRQKANFDTARRMLQHGMPEDMILSMVDGISADALATVRQRLKAETMLASGSAPDDVAKTLSLGIEQIMEIALVVEARNALVRGMSTDEVAESTGIGAGLLDDVDDMLDEALPDHWVEIEEDGPLDAIAAKLVLAEEALRTLRQELAGKSLVHEGVGIGAISQRLGVSREMVVAWASDLPVAQEAARAQRTLGVTEATDLAAANRLPIALIAA